MSVILRDKSPPTCERACGPAVRPRWSLSSLRPGQQAAVRGYPTATCPSCGCIGSWAQGVLRCIVCGDQHVPDRSHRVELVEVGPNVFRTAPVVAFERVLRGGRQRGGRA